MRALGIVLLLVLNVNSAIVASAPVRRPAFHEARALRDPMKALVTSTESSTDKERLQARKDHSPPPSPVKDPNDPKKPSRFGKGKLRFAAAVGLFAGAVGGLATTGYVYQQTFGRRSHTSAPQRPGAAFQARSSSTTQSDSSSETTLVRRAPKSLREHLNSPDHSHPSTPYHTPPSSPLHDAYHTAPSSPVHHAHGTPEIHTATPSPHKPTTPALTKPGTLSHSTSSSSSQHSSDADKKKEKTNPAAVIGPVLAAAAVTGGVVVSAIGLHNAVKNAAAVKQRGLVEHGDEVLLEPRQKKHHLQAKHVADVLEVTGAVVAAVGVPFAVYNIIHAPKPVPPPPPPKTKRHEQSGSQDVHLLVPLYIKK